MTQPNPISTTNNAERQARWDKKDLRYFQKDNGEAIRTGDVIVLDSRHAYIRYRVGCILQSSNYNSTIAHLVALEGGEYVGNSVDLNRYRVVKL